MANKPNIALLCQLYKPHILIGGQVTEGKLYGLVQPTLDGLPGHMQPVVGQADMADFPRRLCLQHYFVQSGAVTGLGTKGRVVKLIEINVLQIREAGFQILFQ